MFSIATSASQSLPKVTRGSVIVEHIRVDSVKPYCDTRAALETLPHFDDSIRTLLRHGDIEHVKSALEIIQGAAGLVIFSIATHGDWLQILSKKRDVVQYVIGNVLVSTQMTSTNSPRVFMPRSGSCSTRTRRGLRLSSTIDRRHSLASMATKT
jgi:hypothetical protein